MEDDIVLFSIVQVCCFFMKILTIAFYRWFFMRSGHERVEAFILGCCFFYT